jgi:uncharacterized membrane protein (DUF106 family)
MTILNAALRPIFDLLQAPLRGLPPWVGILIWSIPIGVLALWVFKKTSNQRRIADVKRRIHACLFEIRLFNDDVAAILRAQGEILRHVAHYQALALKPMIFILPPLVLIMTQLHAFYGFRGLEPGERALVRAVLVSGAGERSGTARPPITLALPAGLHLAADAVWAPELGEMLWQVAADSPGDYELAFTVGDQVIPKTLRVTGAVVRLSPTRPERSFMAQLEWPSEDPLPRSSGLAEISVAYPDGSVALAGWDFEWRYAWMVVFFVLTMVVAVALKKPMGVEL